MKNFCKEILCDPITWVVVFSSVITAYLGVTVIGRIDQQELQKSLIPIAGLCSSVGLIFFRLRHQLLAGAITIVVLFLCLINYTPTAISFTKSVQIVGIVGFGYFIIPIMAKGILWVREKILKEGN